MTTNLVSFWKLKINIFLIPIQTRSTRSLWLAALFPRLSHYSHIFKHNMNVKCLKQSVTELAIKWLCPRHIHIHRTRQWVPITCGLNFHGLRLPQCSAVHFWDHRVRFTDCGAKSVSCFGLNHIQPAAPFNLICCHKLKNYVMFMKTLPSSVVLYAT